MTEADLLDALRKAQTSEAPKGWSSRELSVIFGLAYRNTMIKLRMLVDSGAMEYAGQRLDMAIDGRMVKVPVYRLSEVRQQTAE
jgi:hypothetical protein